MTKYPMGEPADTPPAQSLSIKTLLSQIVDAYWMVDISPCEVVEDRNYCLTHFCSDCDNAQRSELLRKLILQAEEALGSDVTK